MQASSDVVLDYFCALPFFFFFFLRARFCAEKFVVRRSARTEESTGQNGQYKVRSVGKSRLQ